MVFSAAQKRINQFLEKDLRNETYPIRASVHTLRVLYAVFRDLSDGQFSLRAMSLVYITLVTFVPLLALSFSVLKGFGVHNQIEPTLHHLFQGLGPEKSEEIVKNIIIFVDNIKVGVLGVVGLAVLIYAVLMLMQRVESALNYIWRVNDRHMARRFSDYLTVLMVGPLLLFISSGLTTTIRHSSFVKELEESGVLGAAFDIPAVILPWAILSIAFTFVYTFMPNTKVKLFPALVGGFFAGLIWKVMGFAFSLFIANSASYVAIYAAFATMIIFMIWIYLSWLVVLIGANISFYAQNLYAVKISREPLTLSPRFRLALGLGILTLVAEHYYKQKEAWTVHSLSKHFHLPLLAVEDVLKALEEGGILLLESKKPGAYFPACPLDRTPLSKVLDAMEHYGEQGAFKTKDLELPKSAQKTIETLEAHRLKKEGHKTIAQALLEEPPSASWW